MGGDLKHGALTFLDVKLTFEQQQQLSASAGPMQCAFLNSQPASFKMAVRMVKYWAKVVHVKDWDDAKHNRPKSYLLVLLVLKAYQKFMATATRAMTGR